jgi:hypothetical protein
VAVAQNVVAVAVLVGILQQPLVLALKQRIQLPLGLGVMALPLGRMMQQMDQILPHLDQLQ